MFRLFGLRTISPSIRNEILSEDYSDNHQRIFRSVCSVQSILPTSVTLTVIHKSKKTGKPKRNSQAYKGSPLDGHGETVVAYGNINY